MLTLDMRGLTHPLLALGGGANVVSTAITGGFDGRNCLNRPAYAELYSVPLYSSSEAGRPLRPDSARPILRPSVHPGGNGDHLVAREREALSGQQTLADPPLRRVALRVTLLS